MAATRRAQWASFIVGALLMLAGLRDICQPGFLSISPGSHGSGVEELVAGLIILALTIVGWARRARSNSWRV
jgi:hypothetical protein